VLRNMGLLEAEAGVSETRTIASENSLS